MRTLHARFRRACARRISAHARRRSEALLLISCEAGDTLIEVLVSAILIAVIVIGSLTGLDSVNRSTSLDRDRSQADALAQQEQEQLRSEPITKLSELNRVRYVTENGTKYTITTKATYIPDTTATASCSSATPAAEDIRTVSEVTWPSPGRLTPVVETSLIAPPPDTALIVQVTNPVEPVPGATVTVVGPTNVTTETSSDGCAILALEPGEYKINVSKVGNIDQNGYTNSDEDVANTSTDYLVAQTTHKLGYELAPASKIEATFTGVTPAEGDTIVAYNTGQTAARTFGTLASYKSVVSTPTSIFPFKSKYTVYAGSCENDLPTRNGQATNPEVEVPASSSTAVTVPLVPLKVKVMSGIESSKPGSAITGAQVRITDTGCSVTRYVKTAAGGGLTNPGIPFGTYTFCAATGGVSGKKWESGAFTAKSTTGVTWTAGKEPNGGVNGSGEAVVYLGSSPVGTPSGVKEGEC